MLPQPEDEETERDGDARFDEAEDESFAASDPPVSNTFGRGVRPMRKLLVFHGSYRADRAGIRLAHHCVRQFTAGGVEAELIDAKAVGLPILDRMYKEYPGDTAPEAMRVLADKIVAADAFLFLAGEHNWGVRPGRKNLTDHFLEEWFWRPAALATYSAGRFAGARTGYAWHPTLAELGMVAIPSTLAVGPVTATLDAEPIGAGGASLEHSFDRFADELTWWADAARGQHEAVAPPY